MKTNHILLGGSLLALLLILAGACATSTQSASTLAGLPAGPTPAPVAAQATPQQDHSPDDGVPRIKPADALREVKAGNAILVDVRDTGSYENMHAKGAINVTYQSISEGKYDKLPKNKHLIFYCT